MENLTMSRLTLFLYVFTCTHFWPTYSQLITIEQNGILLNITSELQLHITARNGQSIKLRGEIGTQLPRNSTVVPCQNVENCYEFENGTSRLHVLTSVEDSFTIFWTTNNLKSTFEDCFELGNESWYGGPERFEQAWPIDKLNLTNFANVLQEDQWGAVIEPYWLNTAGVYIFVNELVPLFINQNSVRTKNKVCFSAKAADPYPVRNKVVLQYTIAVTDNARKGHQHAVKHFLGKPSGHPNAKIIRRPIWSTWARYKRDVNDSSILKFAQEIANNGYPDGQFEIDDDWEDCYGALTFRKSRFGDINNTVQKIKNMNFSVSLWVHPFVNIDCKKYEDIGRKYGYFVKNTDGSDLTQWWNSQKGEAHYLDFTKPEVREWFVERLRSIQKNHGIDSFKFDAGETSWAPQIPVLQGNPDAKPNNLAVDYVRTCARLGDLVEVRAGWKTQDLPVFVRMIDKDSTWGIQNGLYTLITTLLQMNLNGYTMVLPDMVGGNGYYGAPSPQLFTRWLQANVFMPSIQFSYVPWDYNVKEIDVKTISRRMVDLHEKFAPYILQSMENSIQNGDPVNPPIWWVDPTNPIAQKEDTEFLLGEDVLSAPVIEEGAVSRDIYLPNGTWVDGNNGNVHEGPKLIKNYSAPIELLPYFVRQGSLAHRLNELSY